MDSMGPFNGDRPLAVQPRLNPPDSVATLEFKSVIAKDRRRNRCGILRLFLMSPQSNLKSYSYRSWEL